MTGDPSIQRQKILIVDDEPANVALLEALLQENGYTRVQSLTDSRAALQTRSSSRT